MFYGLFNFILNCNVPKTEKNIIIFYRQTHWFYLLVNLVFIKIGF